MSYQIVIVPGILGSTLERNGKRIYPSLVRMHELPLDPNLTDDRTVPRKVIRHSWEDHFYTLERELQQAQHIEGIEAGPYADLWWCPYDWRRPIEEQSRRLGDLIQDADRPVAIIAHSMGGLLSKHWLLNGDPAHVKKVQYLFTVGTPWLGAPDALDMLADDAKLLWLAFRSLKNTTRTLPSVYQLVTSRKYFRQNGEPYTPPGLNYHQVREVANQFSPEDGRYFDRFNEGSLQKWVYDPLPGGVRHCAVIGTGRKTCVAVNEVRATAYRPVKVKQAGDGTVPHLSANWATLGHPNSVVRYVDAGHGSLCSAQPVWQWIMYTLATGNPEGARINGLLQSPLEGTSERVLVQCPVDVLVSGEDLHFAGSLGDYLINMLPDVRVERYGNDGKLVEMPLGLYSVQLRGTGKGMMTVKHLQEESEHSTLTVFQTKVTADTVAELYRQESGKVILETGTGRAPLKPVDPIYRLRMPAGDQLLAEQILFDDKGPEIRAYFGDRQLNPGRTEWVAASDSLEQVTLVADDESDVETLEWSLDRKRWLTYREPVPVKPDQLQRLHVRATDMAGNRTETTFAFGVASAPPKYKHYFMATPVGESTYVGPLSIQFLPVGPQPLPVTCIWVVINGQDKHRHVPVGQPFVLSEPGPYTVSFQVEDAAGRLGDPITLPPFFLAAAQEIAATTSRIQEAMESGQPLTELTQRYHIRSVIVDGREYDLNEPLPLFAERCEVYLRPVRDEGAVAGAVIRVNVPLEANVSWLPPALGGAEFTRKETVSVKFQVHGGQRRLVRWLSRATAELVDDAGNVTPLPIEHVPELEAGLVLVPCANLAPGKYRVQIRSQRRVLGEQTFYRV